MKNLLLNIYKNNKKFIITMTILLVVGNISMIIKDRFYTPSALKDFPLGMEVEDFDAYIESLKDIQSDIVGYSVYDKYTMGLQRQVGSDSDYDGLTDKEEIEVYGTDPLKASTAGDLYTDSYKINHNMDPFQYADYMGQMTYKFNECEEIGLSATIPSDFNAVISDCTDKYTDLSQYGLKSFVKGYEVYNYAGMLSIDISKLNLNDKFEIYITTGPFLINGYTKFNKCKFDLDNNIVKIDYNFDNHEDYYVYISEKHNFSVNGIFKDFYNPDDKEDFSNLSGDDTAEAFVYGIPLFNFLGGSVHVDYTECKLEENTEVFKSATGLYVDQKVLGGDKEYKKNYNSVNKRTIEIKKGFFDKFLNAFEYIPGEKDNSPLALLFYYSSYKAAYATQQEETNPYYRRVMTGFDKNIDELPFQNFQSYIGNGGNCAGITHLTSYLFNRKELPSSGEYNCNVNGNYEKITWNVGTAASNATLLDPGLIDYKDSNFVNFNSDSSNNYIGETLTDEEMEFVNMVGCFWSEGNDRINMNDYELTYEEKGSMNLINKMIRSIDEGKVLDVYMSMKYGGAHAVNIYGYEWVDKNSLKFYVYDNNLPQDNRSGFSMNESTCSVQVMIQKDAAGNEYFDYLYWPMSDNLEYMSTSKKGLMNTHSFVVMDENWNIFN